MVWDTIYGRDPAQPAVQEWGGISYALSALDATLPDGWELVPLIKVGRDLATRANEFLRTLHHPPHAARFVEVPEANNRVTLRYESAERRCEQMSGGVPPWTWPELGPLIRDVDALYINFISGFEMALETAQLLRRGFPRFIYADLHSLFLGRQSDGLRVPRALPQASDWLSCFDVVQLNEDEMGQLGSDPLVTESRVKILIAADPSAHALHFTLGNQLAAQNRWAKAQQEYFKAYVADPDNADLAYNLAVSLDHLHQRRQAPEYYQRAIALSERRGAGFDLNSARARAAQLAL
jgi:tetratricopeptide (TPR) repeat protein